MILERQYCTVVTDQYAEDGLATDLPTARDLGSEKQLKTFLQMNMIRSFYTLQYYKYLCNY